MCLLTDTAFAKYRDSSTWYNYDDSHVSQISEDKLVVSLSFMFDYQPLLLQFSDV